MYVSVRWLGVRPRVWMSLFVRVRVSVLSGGVTSLTLPPPPPPPHHHTCCEYLFSLQ